MLAKDYRADDDERVPHRLLRKHSGLAAEFAQPTTMTFIASQSLRVPMKVRCT